MGNFAALAFMDRSGIRPCAGPWSMLMIKNCSQGNVFDYPRNFINKTFERGPAKNTAWAFAGTVHKSQGSEYKHVIVLVPPGGLYLSGKASFYTSCSRAQISLTIIGELSSIPRIVERGRHRRITALPLLRGVAKDAVLGKIHWNSAGTCNSDAPMHGEE